MKCPNTTTCPNENLVMTERQGVEIDYCPHCRGVWLDRGELDKLLERAAGQTPTAPAAPLQPAHRSRTDAGQRRDFEDSDFKPGWGGASGHRRKKSWLSDIFD